MGTLRTVGFADIIGHEEIVRRLQDAVRCGCVGHATLLIGPESVGKAPVARALAAALLCANSAVTGDACGECRPCAFLAAGSHPDHEWLAPEGAGEMISIRSLRDRVYSTAIYAPTVGARKVYVLERADRLGLDAANSLLKILEEPPPYVHFILTADSTEGMLLTVLSRCQSFQLGSVDSQLLARRLVENHSLTSEQAALFALFADGAPGKAFQLVNDPQRADALRDLIEFCVRFASAEPAQALRLAEEFRRLASRCRIARPGEEERSSRLAFVVAFDALASWLRDALALVAPIPSSVESLRNRAHEEALRSYARRRGPKKLRDGLKLVLETRRWVLGNSNTQFATERLFAQLTYRQ